MLADVASPASAQVARYVDLGRRFGEREIGGAHPDAGLLAEHLLGEIENALLQIGERDVLVDEQPLDLMEYAVGAVRDRLVAEHAARADHADGRLAALHRADLDRAGVRA